MQAVIFKRLRLIKARLALAIISFLAISTASILISKKINSIEEEINAAKLFEGRQLHVIEKDQNSVDYYEIQSPYIDSLSLFEKNSESTPLLAFINGTTIVNEPTELDEKEVRVAIAVNSKEIGSSNSDTCTYIGSRENRTVTGGEKIKLPFQVHCKQVATPRNWQSVSAITDQQTLVISEKTASFIFGPKWTWKVEKLYLGSTSENSVSYDHVKAHMPSVTIKPSTDSIISKQDIDNKNKLVMIKNIVEKAGAVVCSVFFLLLIAGQKTLLYREIGLLQALGQTPMRRVIFIANNMIIQVAIVFSISTLPLLFLDVEKIKDVTPFFLLMATILTVTAMIFALYTLLQTYRAEPSALIKSYE